ncbi:taf11 [Nucleospora cyclopteri]
MVQLSKTENSKEINDSDSSGDNSSLYSEESVYRKKSDGFTQKLISEMSPEDQQRYEIFRRSNFVKGTIKKYINQVIGQAVNPNMVIGVSGLAKVFVGELVTEAKAIQEEQHMTGPLLPVHINEAMRKLHKKMPNVFLKKRVPWSHEI